MKVVTLLRNKVFSTTAIYIFANGLFHGLPFLLMPLLTRHLSPVEYGKLSGFNSLNVIILPLVGLSLHGAISREFFELKGEHFNRFLSTCLTFCILSFTLFVALSFAGQNQIAHFIAIPEAMIPLAFINACGQSVVTIYLLLMQSSFRSMRFAAMQVAFAMTVISATAIAVYSLAAGGELIAQVQTATSLGFAAISLILLAREYGLRPLLESYSLKKALRFSIPLIPHTLGGNAIIASDKLFIANMVGLPAAGVYDISTQVGMVMRLLVSSFNQAWTPWLFEQLKRADHPVRIRIVEYTYAYYALMLVMVAGFSAISPLAIHFLAGSQYQEANKFVFWILASYGLNGMYFMVSNYIFYCHRTGALAMITLATAIANAILNYTLIRKVGTIGAAQATCLSFLLSVIGTWIVANKLHPMPWRAGMRSLKRFLIAKSRD
jgi:O-antigen/teichoic acid export membrane protein